MSRRQGQFMAIPARRRVFSLTALLPFLTAALAVAQPRPADTEVWEPVPAAVRAETAQLPVPPPSDAIVLFDGSNLDEWVNVNDGSEAGWLLENAVMTVDKSAGNIQTRRQFINYQLHIEWRVPAGTTGQGQSRGNSGLFLASTGNGDGGYELQILDSFENATYVNGMAGSVYKQSIPLVNPSLPPGRWQAYDVIWKAPVFSSEGALSQPATVTAFFNGVLIQDNFELQGQTVFIGQPEYRPHGAAPIKLQAHGDPSPPISFRNIWVRELP